MKDALGAVDSVLLVGGTSEIGLAILRRLVDARARTVVLAVRNPHGAADAAAGLRDRGASVDVVALDLLDTATHVPALDAIAARHGDLDLVVLAAGVLGRRGDDQLADVGLLMQTNAAGAVSVLAAAATRLQAQGHGTLVVLSSVAGVRPRPANFAYGASKTGLDAFALGLADALHGSGVDVLVVRPGFVRTKMTQGLPAAPFAVDADAVARAVVDGLRRRAGIVYVPRGLRVAALVLRALPRALLRRLPG